MSVLGGEEPMTATLADPSADGGRDPIRRVLIANRGEIAVRIAATLRRLGVASVVVRAPDEAPDAPHVLAGDRAIALRRTGERSPYLDVGQLVAIAVAEGCDAVHPGYGFLAERDDAAQAFVDAGVRWIGPAPAAIALLGDKSAAKRTAIAGDVPVVPGLDADELTEDGVRAFAQEHGLPVLLKAAAGGGGKGMRRVDELGQVADAVGAARREAEAAFGRGDLLVERLVEPARHVEVQVAADHHGAAVAIGERECSLQRRHQKLLEESPAPGLSDATRRRLHEAAVRLATTAGYRNLGTVEFLVEAPDAAADPDAPGIFFLEMNARLQVEHPVTELVHRLDLVELQLRIAEGVPLAALLPDGGAGGDHVASGHAIEARICAERTVGTSFLPAVGTVVAYREPAGVGVRVDSGITTGSVVSTAFDPMLMKVIAFGADREQARERLVAALAELAVLGVETNAAFLRRLLGHPDVVAARTTTTLLERLLADEEAGPALREPPAAERARAAVALAAAERLALGGTADAGFGDADGWRVGRRAATRLAWRDGEDEPLVTTVRPTDDGGLEVALDDGEARVVRAHAVAGPADDLVLRVVQDGDEATWRRVPDGEWRWLHGPTGTVAWRPEPARAAGAAAGSGSLEAPLPGVVLAVRAPAGTRVAAGETVVVLESMKMELDVSAPRDGVVAHVDVAVGDHVQRGQVLAAVEEEDEA
jgi:acetyl-CoA/propionyl-CoA carboxylase biotin carboxyl carrier protein